MNHCCRAIDDVAWYVNGTLPASSRREFEAHLETCAECRSAVALDARLARTLQATAANVLPAPQSAWRRLEERLAAEPPAGAAMDAGEEQPPRLLAGATRRHRLLQFVVAAQAAAILVLSVALWLSTGRVELQDFRTVGNPDASVASVEPLVRVVIQAGPREVPIGEIAASVGAELRGEPIGQGIYTLAVTIGDRQRREERVAEVVSALRRHPAVMMAEPVTDPQVGPGEP